MKIKDMYKVKINVNTEEVYEHSVITKIPKIPNNGDLIGLWIENEWCIYEVSYVVYELNKNNSFNLIEINCK
jgi:hypothetical protein